MFTHSFQLIMIASFLVIASSLIAYGIYCRRRVRSYIGTGRVADIETWSMKAAASWVATFGLTLMLILHFA